MLAYSQQLPTDEPGKLLIIILYSLHFIIIPYLYIYIYIYILIYYYCTLKKYGRFIYCVNLRNVITSLSLSLIPFSISLSSITDEDADDFPEIDNDLFDSVESPMSTHPSSSSSSSSSSITSPNNKSKSLAKKFANFDEDFGSLDDSHIEMVRILFTCCSCYGRHK